MKSFCLMLFAAGTVAAAATEYGQTIRSTELKAQPSADAANVATLAEKTRVEVLSRKGAWFEVKAPDGNGWLRMLAVRSEAVPGAATGGKSGGGLAALGHLVTGSASDTPVATGVRGLSEEDLQHAQANPAQFEKLQTLAVAAPQARQFAGKAQLQAQSVAYLPGGTGHDKGEAK